MTTSWVGVPVSLVASGGQPIAIQGDPHYSGALMIALSTALVPYWNTTFHALDVSHFLIGQVASYHTPVDVTVGRKFTDVNNTQIVNGSPILSPDPTAVAGPGGPIVQVIYGNESTQNITTLYNDLAVQKFNPGDNGAVGVLKGSAGLTGTITTVYYSPLGAALANGTADGNFNNLVNAADGIMFQTQRQGQFTMSLAAYKANLQPTVTAIRAGTSKPMLMQCQVYDPNNPTFLMDVSTLVQIINMLGNAFNPAAISLYFAGAANQVAATALAQLVFTYFRP